MKDLAPILLFVYNRPWHTKQTLEALSQNELADQSTLYIFCDGPKPDVSQVNLENIATTRQVIREKQWTKNVIIYENETNRGLADSIVKGVTEVINKHGKVIVLEDDIVTSKGFLKYMNDALDFYNGEEQVMHISGYWFPVKDNNPPLPDTFFYRSTSCWGWGTWKRAWDKMETDAPLLRKKLADIPGGMKQFSMNNSSDHLQQLERNISGDIHTWAVKWYASVFINKGLCLHPNISLANNIGFDNSGVNCNTEDSGQYYWNELASYIPVNKIELSESKLAIKYITKFYRRNYPFILHQMKKLVPSGLKEVIKKNFLGKPSLYGKNSLSYLKYYPRYKETTITLMGKETKIADSASFLFMHKEIFKKDIFKFNTTDKTPYIIDAGANIGLATLYFKKLYPESKVVAFEPDPKIYRILEHNIKSWELNNVVLVNKALSDKESFVSFFSEGADGGRINGDENGTSTIQVPTVSLRNYLDNQLVVNFLKIDIEGAEIEVLNDIRNSLQHTKMIFVEYHSFANKPQRLEDVINTLTANNFRIYINAPGLSPENPFQSVPVISGMDMQLNIYGIKNDYQNS